MEKKIRNIRIKASLKNLDYLYNTHILNDNIYNGLKNLLELRKNFNAFLDISKNDKLKKPKALVAFSGGVDSVASSIIAKKIFDITAITAYSPIIMRPDNKKNISELAKKLNIKHEFVDIDLNEVQKDTLNGKYHPCGRCHKIIEKAVLSYAKENDIKYIIYGDMLSVGYLSIIQEENDIIRINMPSYLVITKNDSRKILKKNNITISQKYGCPLLRAAHKYNHNKKFTIQRILREVRAQVIDKDEGLNNILEVLNI
ncbi:7-cyano-7-deazaguanine synthase [Methanothermococcus okinawensis]|uniref:Queuosine synthesis-like protein n=1 Tax=Methanothermococcus okinawensis (strain DSM 14208 / JCM 11175 / IH1) TaxID=647113 RepID=F8AMG8_METOI|nr:7-cyano-7-deazaguanine synthase [Methanothermococcus okinawensis]AEH06008.1 Queuosine synthesis-like protein [Methanothermococcus okinawensis IH1]